MKKIPTIVGILIIVFVVGIAGTSILFFNQEKEEIFVELEKEFIGWEKGKRIIIPVEDFSNFEEVILYYLNKYPDNEEVLDDLFFDFYYDERKFAEEKEWIEFPESRGEDFIEKLVRWTGKADIKGDGEEELVIVFVDSHAFYSAQNPHFGDRIYLAVFSYDENKYSLDFLSESDFFRDFSLMDVNNNGKKDIIFVNYNCGAHTCGVGVRGIHFSGGEWENLIKTERVPYTTADSWSERKEKVTDVIEWTDLTGNGRKEVVIKSGGFSPTAGTEHDIKTKNYGFDEEKNEYQLIEVK